MPCCSEVAALIVGDLDEENVHRNIIVEHRREGLQRISELHPSFMAMRYPLLFPYGEDGYRIGIRHQAISSMNNEKRKNLTMREYYAYRIQQRRNEGMTLLRGGWLFQQFLVDSYTCIEEERLGWVRKN